MKIMKFTVENIAKGVLRAASRNWKPYSRLILYGDNIGWVLDWEMRALRTTCEQLGVKVAQPFWKHAAQPQSFFFSNHFFLLNVDWQRLLPGRIGLTYFHGLPDTGDMLFDSFYELLCNHHQFFTRIQVSHSQMRDVTLRAGVDPSKVKVIPIGINTGFFPFRTESQKSAIRSKLGIPESSFVIGSFQKDGQGWEDGLEPKLIKGPDVFLATLDVLKKDVRDIFVLLSAPARGYVKRGLEKMNIPYKHIMVQSYPEISRLFQALDVYLMASRQEGGPKSILESMSTGVPIVSTRAGQAMDLIKHGENGWMVNVEDVEGLARCLREVHEIKPGLLKPILNNARATAEANSYESQRPLWADFMNGFVEMH